MRRPRVPDVDDPEFSARLQFLADRCSELMAIAHVRYETACRFVDGLAARTDLQRQRSLFPDVRATIDSRIQIAFAYDIAWAASQLVKVAASQDGLDALIEPDILDLAARFGLAEAPAEPVESKLFEGVDVFALGTLDARWSLLRLGRPRGGYESAVVAEPHIFRRYEHPAVEGILRDIGITAYESAASLAGLSIEPIPRSAPFRGGTDRAISRRVAAELGRSVTPSAVKRQLIAHIGEVTAVIGQVNRAVLADRLTQFDVFSRFATPSSRRSLVDRFAKVFVQQVPETLTMLATRSGETGRLADDAKRELRRTAEKVVPSMASLERLPEPVINARTLMAGRHSGNGASVFADVDVADASEAVRAIVWNLTIHPYGREIAVALLRSLNPRTPHLVERGELEVLSRLDILKRATAPAGGKNIGTVDDMCTFWGMRVVEPSGTLDRTGTRATDLPEDAETMFLADAIVEIYRLDPIQADSLERTLGRAWRSGSRRTVKDLLERSDLELQYLFDETQLPVVQMLFQHLGYSPTHEEPLFVEPAVVSDSGLAG